MSLSLDILFEYWIGLVIFGLLYVMLRISTRWFYWEVPGFATDCLVVFGAMDQPLVSCMLVHFLEIEFEMIEGFYVWHNGQQPIHCFNYISIYIYFYIYLNASQYDNTLSEFTLNACLNSALFFTQYLKTPINESVHYNSLWMKWCSFWLHYNGCVSLG